VESLERRALLASITPSAVISSKPVGSDFDYTITLTNSSSSTSAIGTFWYAWIPGEDFLATKPLSVTPPTGWSDQITNGGAGDGYAIMFTANSSTYYVQPGHSLNFPFESADTPASVNGDSKFYPGTPVGTSFVYPQGAFSDSGHQFVVTPALDSIAITPANPGLPKGETQQFTATGTFDGGSTQNLTTKVTWSSGTTTVATISSGGLATAAATGTSKITATLSGISATTVLTVTAPALVSLAVTPANPNLPKGETDQFIAIGTFSDKSTQDLTNLVTWASATTTVATISGGGLATAVTTGTSKISATLKGVSGSTVLTVTPAVLVSIAVTPADPSLPKGETEAFIATGTYSDKSTQNLTTKVTWASATMSVATISNTSGSQGLATAAATGTSKITATLSFISGTTVLTVTAPVLVSLAVTPANPSLAKGGTLQFTAMGTFSDKSTEDLTSLVTWASATMSVATISGGGLATAVATGTSKITATLQGVSGSTVLTVTAPTAAATASLIHHRRPSGHRRGLLQLQAERHAPRVSDPSVLSETGPIVVTAPERPVVVIPRNDSRSRSFFVKSW
jgi:hypothetical protein